MLFDYPLPPFDVENLLEARARRRASSTAGPKSTAIVFTALSGLFALRVLGQLLVEHWSLCFLPAMECWYRTVVPYPALLPAQLAILSLEAFVARDLWRSSGFFDRPRPRAGRLLRWVGWGYLTVMVLRVPLTLALGSTQLLVESLIPIVFHWVLAATLLLYATYLRRGAQS